jgi:hypothetical protein
MPKHFWTYALTGTVAALWIGAISAADDVAVFGRSAGEVAGTVNRTAKADRLPIRGRDAETATVAAVEIVGLRDAAIIYRDRDGRILYKSDPVANVTLISKGVLPEVTVKEHRESGVQPMSIIRAPAAPVVPIEPVRPAKPQRVPMGCDTLISPLADPARAAPLGRCLASDLHRPVAIAALAD